jgi:hypothetical protein
LELDDWSAVVEVVGCIQLHYLRKNDCSVKDASNGYIPDSVLYIACAENRAFDFDIGQMDEFGNSTKWKNDKDQSGRFGEGVKVGAVAAHRDGFELDIHGNGGRRLFIFKKNRDSMNPTLHARREIERK